MTRDVCFVRIVMKTERKLHFITVFEGLEDGGFECNKCKVIVYCSSHCIYAVDCKDWIVILLS
jgi:hypothetical protein